MKVPVRIPENAEILIQTGQTVDFDTPFLRRGEKKRIEVPLSKVLNFVPEKIFLALKKVIGDVVKKGELLAENKAFLSTKQYFSQVDGKISEVNHISGSIVLDLDSEDSKVVNCYFTGEVVGIHDDHIEINAKKVQKVNIQETANDFLGTSIFYLPESGHFSEDDIENKYICASEINPLDHIKVEALGAKGYITDSKKNLSGNFKQIVLDTPEDLEHIKQHKYPYCIIGLNDTSLFFYEI